ncbi:hypothetical protein NDU88_004791, partial [Pleurodeles waltl]
DKVVLRTKAAFLLKIVTPFHLGQSITLSSFYPPPHPSKDEERLHRLDPRRALSFFVDMTREFRQDDQLFVGYVGKRKGRAVHKTTLSSVQRANVKKRSSACHTAGEKLGIQFTLCT